MLPSLQTYYRFRQISLCLVVLFLWFFSVACSVYQTSVRKDFEDKAPTRLQLESQSHCRVINPAQFWWESEFPQSGTEIVHRDEISEVWILPHEDGYWIQKSFSKISEFKYLTCDLYSLSEDGPWEEFL